MNEVQADGKLYFTLKQMREKFNVKYESALKFSINRLINKSKIVSVHKGFYVIIPPEYSRQKILPPELFIDALFNFLKRPYYVGLLSAAFYHGASHQQPQEYFILIDKPAMRSTKVKGLKINYVVKSNIKTSVTENKKTSTGYLKISTPEQTAIDLVHFQKRVGGMNRVSTIIDELAESMKAEELKKILPNCKLNAVLQRFGYILDKIVNGNDLSDVIYNYLTGKKIYVIPLKTDKNEKGETINRKWKIIENTKIEIDF